MKKLFLGIVVGLFTCLTWLVAQPFGLENRVPNTTLALPQNPAVFGYDVVFEVGITNAISVTTPPGETNRLFILQRSGRIFVVTNLAAPTLTTFLDISGRVLSNGENGLLGIAFHPGYLTNRHFFLFYTLDGGTVVTNQRVSRFEINPANTNKALDNELTLISQVDDSRDHNGGDIHFGPDGYLYISVGDEGMEGDPLNNSQRIDKDFFSGILRIDVDKQSTNRPPTPHPALLGATNYFVPADNPFVGATTFNGLPINTNALRAEFWAVGLRNPWRFSFDIDGTLYCGDVGGSSREEVNIVRKGGNYGWARWEGTLPGPKTNQVVLNPIPPIIEYSHCSPCNTNQGNAVTGGLVYRGRQLSQLAGKYVFADYISGNLWAVTPNGTNVVTTNRTRLLGISNIASFGRDPRNGEILIVHLSGLIFRLIYNTNSMTGTPLPPTLAQTGAFSNLATLSPQPGIVPYDLNVPFWSDNAKKTRWFSVPNTNLTMQFSRESNWSFPTGTVWIKHFDLEMTNGVPSSARRLETRFLVRNPTGVYGATYRWGNSTTNAQLVPEGGMDETFLINDGGIIRTQVWRYPSRSECLTCHSAVGGLALGFNTPQLNRDFNYGGTPDNQIRALNHAGYFSTDVTNLHTLKALAHATNDSWSVEWRVRSYLAANCVQCHQPGGAGLGDWDARITNPLSGAGIINGMLIKSLGDPANRKVVPNDLTHSVLLTRISSPGQLRMPPLASNLIDSNSVALLSAWITNGLANYQTYAQWQVSQFGSTGPLTGPNEDFDGDRSLNFQEYLLGTDPDDASEAWGISLRMDGTTPRIEFDHIANRGFEVQFANQFEPPFFWQRLEVFENRPFIPAATFPASIPDPLSPPEQRFYRVRVFEP